jgi:hypothetical protein
VNGPDRDPWLLSCKNRLVSHVMGSGGRELGDPGRSQRKWFGDGSGSEAQFLDEVIRVHGAGSGDSRVSVGCDSCLALGEHLK